MDAFLGTILLWPVTFVPQDWLECDGSPLQINQYQALYSLLGLQFGGDGVKTFNLPDLRGRVPVGRDPNAVALTDARIVGAKGGATTFVSKGTAVASIGVANLPPHNHTATFTPGAGTPLSVSVAIPAVSNPATTTDQPGSTVSLAKGVTNNGDATQIFSGNNTDTTLKPFSAPVTGGGTVAVGNTGNGAALTIPVSTQTQGEVVPPFTTLRYIICTVGIYPMRP